jgi:beta-N-acetylhexosaminidase
MPDAALSIEQLCGQLLLGGFAGERLSEGFARALGRGERAGAILFKRNLANLEQICALNRDIAAHAPAQLPPFIALDQEGGRVVRLPPPFLALPPMRQLGAIDDVELTRRAAAEVGAQLCASGFNLDFAPVMDVDSIDDSPVIGDRAFGRDVRTVMRHGVAFIRGMQGARVLACAKHYPGHGDAAVDSHVDRPLVAADRERLLRLELPPFRAASGAGVASMMTAHVVYPALDGALASFSRVIATDLLRGEIGFEGVLFSDDLEMGAVANHAAVEEAAIEAVRAGCDVLIVSKDEALQERVHAALSARARADEAFAARCREAAARSLRARRLCPPRVESDDVVRKQCAAPEARQLLETLARRYAALGPQGGDGPETSPVDPTERRAPDDPPPSGPRAADGARRR